MPPPGPPLSRQLLLRLLCVCASFCCVYKFICVILVIPHKSDIIWYLSLFLTSFTYFGKVKFLPYCCKWHYYILCCGWVVIHHIHVLYLLDLSKGTQFVSVLTTMRSAPMNIGVHVCLWRILSSGCMPRSEISGSYGSSICIFLWNSHTVLHWGFTSILSLAM